jgi:hypothetical protein
VPTNFAIGRRSPHNYLGAADWVVLQKVIEDRKLLGKGIGYALTPKISAMNFTRSVTALFSVVLQKLDEDRKLLDEGMLMQPLRRFHK